MNRRAEATNAVTPNSAVTGRDIVDRVATAVSMAAAGTHPGVTSGPGKDVARVP
jgi:hypothetical protein